MLKPPLKSCPVGVLDYQSLKSQQPQIVFRIPNGLWTKARTEKLNDRGITGGYQGYTYRLENQVTEEEMAVILVKKFNLSLP